MGIVTPSISRSLFSSSVNTSGRPDFRDEVGLWTIMSFSVKPVVEVTFGSLSTCILTVVDNGCGFSVVDG